MGDRTAFIVHFDHKQPGLGDKILMALEDCRFVSAELASVGLITGWDKGSYPGFFIETQNKLPAACLCVSVTEDGRITVDEPE